MLRRRVSYAALLLGAVLFQIFFRFYLSTFTLVLVVLLPGLSVLLSLPGLLNCALLLSSGGDAPRGGEGVFTLRAERRGPFPLPPVKVRLSWTNQLTGQGGQFLCTLRPGEEGAETALTVPLPHCGRVVCRVEGASACDLLGLFPLPVPGRPSASLLSLPLSAEAAAPEELDAPRAGGAALKPRPGGGPGEDYDLRDYRPGDPLRSVHWKLSSKREALVVKEVLEPRRAAIVLTYDHFGPPEELDAALERLCALSRWLLARGRPHHIRWADPAGGTAGRLVDGEEALGACLAQALSTPAPAAGPSILDMPLGPAVGPGPVRRVHVTPGGWKGAGL